MPTPNDPVPNCVQVKLYWGTSSQVSAQNVLNFLNTGAVLVSQALADQLMTQIGGIFSTSGLAAIYSGPGGLRQVGVRNLALANQAEFVSAGAGVAGTLPDEALPYGIAFCVTLRTAMAGKSFRGRLYLSGFGESQGAGNTALSAVGTACVAFVNGIRTSLGSAPNLDMCIVSRYSKGELRPTPITTEVTGEQARNPNWDSQRRRLKPGGAGALYAYRYSQVEMLRADEWARRDQQTSRSFDPVC
jgi:hypothetical protein